MERALIFVDTGAFLAIENRRDANHRRALAFRDESLEAGELLVTSDYVLDESYTIIRLRAGHAIAVEFGEAVRTSRVLRVESVTPQILDRAWVIFKTFSDNTFTFTDCTSFGLKEELGITTVFTVDEHFRQYGAFTVKP